MSEQKYEEVFEEGGAKEARTVHRMRANSTIMKVQKILGESPGPPARHHDGIDCAPLFISEATPC